MTSPNKISRLGRLWGLFSTALLGFVLLVFCFGFLFLSSSCGKKKPDPAESKPLVEAETLPDNVERFNLMLKKEGALHNIGNGGLGIFSTHPDSIPDAGEVPPTIMSPDPFFKAHPEGHKENLK